MKKSRLECVLFVCILCMATLVHAQDNSSYIFPPQLDYKDGLVQTMGGGKIICSTITIIPDSNTIRYFDLNANEIKTSNLKEIDIISIVSGNKAAIEGLLGALGGISAFALIFQASGGENTKMSESTLNGLCVGCTGCGFISGVVAGADQKTYKAIYQNGNFIN